MSVLSRLIRGVFSLALAFFALAIVTQDGQAAPSTPFANFGTDLDGHPLTALAPPEDLVVLIFVASDCPISNRYMPEFEGIQQRFAGQPVRFWAVYPNSSDTSAIVRAHLASYGQSLPALLDPDQHLVALARTHVTPEAAVFLRESDGKRREVYRGRIDNRYLSFGHERPQATQHDLEDAITAALAGQPVHAPGGPPVGCAIVPAGMPPAPAVP